MKRSEYLSVLEKEFYTDDNMKLAKAFVGSIGKAGVLPASHGHEIGCGFGVAAGFIKPFVDSLSVWDIDCQSLDFIRWKYSDSITICDTDSIPPDTDFIYYFMSLHHMCNFRESLRKTIDYMLNQGGKGLALCELIPATGHKFHLNEDSAFDGLPPDSFDFVNDIKGISTHYSSLPALIHNDIIFNTYSLIIKPS